MIAPISVETFFVEYFERKPLVIHREDPAYYKGQFSSKVWHAGNLWKHVLCAVAMN